MQFYKRNLTKRKFSQIVGKKKKIPKNFSYMNLKAEEFAQLNLN